MIQPEDFPYIASVYINECYSYQKFNIELAKHKPFSNLILTGKNGDGKSTILNSINDYIQKNIIGIDIDKQCEEYNELIRTISNDASKHQYEKQILKNKMLKIQYRNGSLLNFSKSSKQFLVSYLDAKRNSTSVNDVTNPIAQNEYDILLYSKADNSNFFTENFKQYLVNKKVNQAFAQIENQLDQVRSTEYFFKNLEEIFGKILGDDKLKLVFENNYKYDFYLKMGDGRHLTFNILPDGFSAFISVIMDLFLRLDLIRKAVNNDSYDPCGIVLIDEPETHLHLSLQYQVLPILTSLFPNVQFIVATHSPAVISSIKKITIFDLTSKQTMFDEAVGKSFSELMVSHFGLDNEFSNITDSLFDKANDIIKKNKNNPTQLNLEIKQFIKENELYISPAMRFELESKLAEI